VYVSKKPLRSKLAKSDLLPDKVEGVPIDVVEVGEIEPLDL